MTPIQQTQDFYSVLHRGGTHAYAQQIGQRPMGTYWWRVGEPMRLPFQGKGTAVYVCVNPLTVRVTDEDRKNYPGQTDKYIEQRVAGKEEAVECVNALYREYDGKDFTGGKRKAEKERIYQTNPEYYKALALAAVRQHESLFSAITDSGGGYNCYTFFKETFYIRSAEDRKYIQDLQKRWVYMDPAADQGVNDLRRIFRPAGTMNYKELYAPNYPTVSFYKFDQSVAFDHTSILALLPPVVAVAATPARQPSHNQARAAATPYEGVSVIDAWNAAHRIEDELDKYDYPKAGKNKRSSPDTTNRCVSVFPETNSMRCWSENDKAYHGGRKVDCFTLYRYHEHGGDMVAAVKAAAAELGIEKKSPAPAPLFSARLAAIREWAVTADFSQIIPSSLHSSKGYRTHLSDLRAFMAVLDIFERYGKFSGPISKAQGSSASGLSDNGFHNAMKRLAQSPLLDCDAPEQDGSYWYSLTVAYFDGVGVVNKATPTPSKYATVFNQEKAEDAWQRGGSKRQRVIATIKSCGPDALLAVTVLPVGERVHQAVLGERIHKNKSSVSRLIKRLEDYNIVKLERIGRQNYITLLPDWQEQVAARVQRMPTYGNKFRRELNAHVRITENCDRRLARKLGDPVKLAEKREQAARKAFAMMESEIAYRYQDIEVISEKMRRLLRDNSLRRNASAEKKTVQSLDVATHRNNQAKATWQLANSPSAERRTNELMQELEENEMLLEARAELRRAA